MSRLTDLINLVSQKDAILAEELRKEFKEYSSRRQFGLNFERHLPETVRLYNKPIHRGDKVNILPTRGEREKAENNRIWIVKSIYEGDSGFVAEVEPADAEPASGAVKHVPLDDLVAVAVFSEPIYPGLQETGRVERGGDKPYHVVINGENYHALETLLYVYEGKVDCIYIDPPYNTGDKSWKYNNDYVDNEDAYRHSKWLAFMERRLKLVKRLLNPEDSVLIVTIDEKEYLRLGLLLEQVFSSTLIQMVSIVINPLGQERAQRLARVEEYAFFVFLGQAAPSPLFDDLLNRYDSDGETKGSTGNKTSSSRIRWEWLLRGGADATRQRSPNLFYPVFVDPIKHKVHSVGEPLLLEQKRSDIIAPEGTVSVWPIRTNGEEGRWRCSPSYYRKLLTAGYARVGEYDKGEDRWSLLYLGKAQIKRIEDGDIQVLGYSEDGSLLLDSNRQEEQKYSVKTIWYRPSHRAGEYGTSLNRALIPGRKFPFPKSLYAVEDALRIVVLVKPNALVVDFFAGSGTTAHAVMRLNHQDGGQRRCVMVTNNEVSDDESKTLTKNGYRQGDTEWEALGICEYITKPRVTSAITGTTPEGEPIKGDYKFIDEFPMAEGFEENAVFYNLTYQDELTVELDRAFAEIAPLLWMRAGSQGRCISERKEDYDIADNYAVLFDYQSAKAFLEAIKKSNNIAIAFIVTNQDSRFQDVAQKLPEGIESIRLYESYIRSFKINQGEA